MMEHIGLENVLPAQIEARSFEIITEELGDTPLVPGTCCKAVHPHECRF